jgi:hypothetical protein
VRLVGVIEGFAGSRCDPSGKHCSVPTISAPVVMPAGRQASAMTRHSSDAVVLLCRGCQRVWAEHLCLEVMGYKLLQTLMIMALLSCLSLRFIVVMLLSALQHLARAPTPRSLAPALSVLPQPGRTVESWNKDHVWNWVVAWGQPDLAARLHDAHVNGAVLIGLYWDAVHENFTQWGRWGGSPVEARAVVAVCQYLADADFVLPGGDWVRGWVAVYCVVALLVLGFLLVCGGIVWWHCVVALCGGIVWWHCVVALRGGTVWWHCVVALCGGAVWCMM